MDARFIEPDYALNGENKTRIEHIFYGNPNTVGNVIYNVMRDLVVKREEAYIVYHVDEQQYFLFSSQVDGGTFRARLCELGDEGIDMGVQIPKIDHRFMVPMASITPGDAPDELNFHFNNERFVPSDRAIMVKEQIRSKVMKNRIQ